MGLAVVVLSIVLLVLIVVFAIWVARRVQKAIDVGKTVHRQGKALSKPWALLCHAHGIWPVLVMVGGGLDYIYKEWKTAPPASLEKLGWSMLIALIVALAMFAILKLLDRKINGEPEKLQLESSNDVKA